MLAIASATGGAREASQEDLLGGIALELMHLASLYHDDVMDEAEIRRNVDSRERTVRQHRRHRRRRLPDGALGGDRGRPRHRRRRGCSPRRSRALPAARSPRSAPPTTSTRTVDDYFEAIGGKTATLMASSCRVGALTSGRDADVAEALGAFGHALRHGVPDPRRPAWTSSRSTASWASPPARTWARGSTRCRCSSPSTTPRSASSCARCSASRSTSRSARRPARWSRRRAASSVALDEGERWAAIARTALDGVPEPALRAGFGALVSSLLAEVPAPLR